MEQRRFRRIPKLQPMKFKAIVPESDDSKEIPAFLQDFSLGGIFFKSKEPPTFAVGHAIDFHIDTTSRRSPTEKPDYHYFKGQGKVVRIEPPGAQSSFFGIAVEFLTPMDMSKYSP